MATLKAPFPASASPALARALELLGVGALSIDPDGRIWRLAILRRGRWIPVTPRRAESPSGKGYLRITLQVHGTKTASVQAHILIWVSANGPIPEGLQVNHKDLDKKNNRLSNLEVVTPSGNIRHSYANGRPKPYFKIGPSAERLSRTALVRHLGSQGKTISEISSLVGVSKTHVQRLIGTKRPTARFSIATIDKAVRMVRDGETHASACAATGISRTHLQRHLKRTA